MPENDLQKGTVQSGIKRTKTVQNTVNIYTYERSCAIDIQIRIIACERCNSHQHFDQGDRCQLTDYKVIL